jgi:hypothetical protein
VGLLLHKKLELILFNHNMTLMQFKKSIYGTRTKTNNLNKKIAES